MATIELFLQRWTEKLRRAGVENPRLEAEIFYSEYACVRRGSWFPNTPVDSVAAARTEAAITRRMRREPLQYILGSAPFRELELEVTPDVLIPRPETELLVDHLLRRLPERGTLLDVGVGSGAIVLSALFERGDVSATGVDVSPAALSVTRRNAEKYALTSRLSLLESDLLSCVSGRFHAISANLPYVPESVYADLQPEVLREPKLALTAPQDGLALVFRLAETAQDHLLPGGFLIFEIGETQAGPLAERLREFAFESIDIHLDYRGVERFVSCAAPDRR